MILKWRHFYFCFRLHLTFSLLLLFFFLLSSCLPLIYLPFFYSATGKITNEKKNKIKSRKRKQKHSPGVNYHISRCCSCWCLVRKNCNKTLLWCIHSKNNICVNKFNLQTKPNKNINKIENKHEIARIQPIWMRIKHWLNRKQIVDTISTWPIVNWIMF